MELNQKEKNKPHITVTSVTIKETKDFCVLNRKIKLEEGQLREEVKKRGNWFTRIFRLPKDAEGTAK